MLITAVKTQKRFRHRLERQYALYLKEKHRADWLQNRRSGHISLPLIQTYWNRIIAYGKPLELGPISIWAGRSLNKHKRRRKADS